jgi:hypothetical protein
MSSNDLVLYGGIVIVLVVIGLYLFYWYREKRKTPAQISVQPDQTLSLKLQAYERLVLLTERISLPNLITRIPSGGMNAREMQQLLIETIKNEFDYNLSQQIYVSTHAWQAVNNLREQNIFIINQVAQGLSDEAKGTDLCRRIADVLQADEGASLHPVVLKALNFEAKKLM